MVKPGPKPLGEHNKVESKNLHKLGRVPKRRAAGRAVGRAAGAPGSAGKAFPRFHPWICSPSSHQEEGGPQMKTFEKTFAAHHHKYHSAVITNFLPAPYHNEVIVRLLPPIVCTTSREEVYL